MEIRVRGDCVEIEGYVNAVERKSKPLMSRMGRFIERICKGAFRKALGRADNVVLLLNHDDSKAYASTRDGNLKLNEDNIGLHARAIVKDAEFANKARAGEFVGWSFGFNDVPDGVENKRDEDGFPLRDVKDLDLKEVSILDRSHTPAYDGTLVAVRSEQESLFFGEQFADEIQIRELTEEVTETEQPQSEDVPKQQETVAKNINYDKWDAMIADMKN